MLDTSQKKSKALRSGILDSYDSLSPENIDNLGDYYIEHIYKRTLGQYFGRTSRWRIDQFPEDVQAWARRIKGGEVLSRDDKRDALIAWYADLNRGPDSELPSAFKRDFRKSKVGFTEDVMDRSLLEGPVG